MAILPVVGLEQVIVQSPAMLPERVKEQQREEGQMPVRPSPGTGPDRDDLAPVSGVEPVHPVDGEPGSEEGVEKEIDSEYAPRKGRKENAVKRKSSGKSAGRSDGKGRLLNIEA
jgi:hypothetical protein